MIYKTGDVVRLRSGGPCMTVFQLEGQADSDLINVSWFRDDILLRDAFTEKELMPVLTIEQIMEYANEQRKKRT